MAAPTCYWCGKPATSRDHVPPLTLFPKDRRTNLITVPSCYDHNEAFSQGDEKFRFYLQACSDSPDALELFETKTMRGLSRPEAAKQTAKLFQGSLPVFVSGGETRALQVNPTEQNLFFEKIVRGLYFHIFEQRTPETVATVSPHFMTPGLDYNELGRKLLPYLFLPGALEPKIEHPEIFKYRYYHYTEENREAFIVRLTFYGSVAVVGMCTRNASVRKSRG